MTELERIARAIAAEKMGLVKDPSGVRLPDDLWQQAIPLAIAAIEKHAAYAQCYNADEITVALLVGRYPPLDYITQRLEQRGGPEQRT